MATNPNIALTADNKRFIAAMEQAAGSVGRFAATVNVQLANSFKQADFISSKFEKGIGRVGERIRSVGETLTKGFTLPLIALGGAAYKTFADIDALERSLSQYGVTMKEVKELAKLPGLGLEEAASSLTALLSVKFNADLARRAMIGFGNALVSTGKGKAELDGINLALTQMKGKGKISAEEINQIAERLPLIRDLMVKAFGTADTMALQKMGISADKFLEKIVVQLEKLPKATVGPKAIMENFFDSLKLGGYEVGKAIERSFNISGKVDALGAAIERVTKGFADLDPGVQKNILSLTAFAAAVGPLSIGLGTLTKLTPSLVKGFGMLTSTTSLAVASVVALSAGFYSLYKTYNPTIDSASKLVDITEDVAQATETELIKVRQLVAVAGDDKKSKDDRKKALEQLKASYPDYFGKLDLEKSKTNDLKGAYDGLYNSIIRAAGARVAQGRLEKMTSDQFDDNDRLNVLRGQLKEATKAAEELRNVDIAMGNPVGTSSQASVSVISAQIRNVKNQMWERKQAMIAMAQLANMEIPAPKGPTTPDPTGPSGKSKAKKIGYMDMLDISMSSLEDPIGLTKKKLKPMLEYYERISDTTQKSLSENLKARTFKIDTPAIQIDPARTIASMQAGLSKLSVGLAKTWASIKDAFASIIDGEALGSAMSSFFESVGSSFNEKGGVKKILSSFAGLIGDLVMQMGQVLLKAAGALLAAAIFSGGALGSEFIRKLAGGAALVTAGAAIKAVKFAQGGVVRKPTYAMFGEYPGAFTNPEIAGRFDQFRGLLMPLFDNAVMAGRMMASPTSATAMHSTIIIQQDSRGQWNAMQEEGRRINIITGRRN